MRQAILTIIMLLISIFYLDAQNETRLLRFPAVHGDQVVFSYAGDIYTVSKAGGVARKLTNHEGYEMFPRFSPDGTQLAFTAQYDGNTEVYLMPSAGGIPVRLTYTATLNRDDISDRMGPNNIVMTWTPDGKEIIYRSRKQSFNDFTGQLFKVSRQGGLSSELPFPRGGFCSYSEDGKKMAYNRVFREFRTWKYYRGGMADDIWIYDFQQRTTTNITHNDAQDIIPMWYKNRIYFLSDRDRTMNLFVYDVATSQTRKVTNFTDYDIKFPSLGDQAIVFEKGGYLFSLDLASEQVAKIPVLIADDFLAGRNELVDASKNIVSYEISPDGKRALFWARGDIWTIPAEHGITRNLTKSSGVHDRNPLWSPDGKYIAYISDQSGEDEIYIINQDGSEKPVALTTNGDTYKYSVVWSPDSKKLMWSDKKLRLQYVDIESRKIVEVESSSVGEFYGYVWSPDSKWIAFSRPRTTGMNILCLYNLAANQTYEVTDEWYGSSSPAFSENGKYLFFVSDRDFSPTYSQVEWNYAYQDMEGIYMITLAKDTPSPFAPINDEVTIKKDEATGKEETKPASEDESKTASKDIVVDMEGIRQRVIGLPVASGNYRGIRSVGEKIYYGYSSSKGGRSIKLFDLKEKKETDLNYEGGFEISFDGKKILLGRGSSYYIIDLPSGPVKTDKPLDLSGMKTMTDFKAEWKQIFTESWRQMRDFFYVPNMHGVDWEAMKDKYGVMLPYVNNRNDLNYLIGEMISELSIGHAYINGGDKPQPERIQIGLLGATLSRDPSGYYRVDHILKGQNWSDNLRSPLTEVGVNVNEGDYILAVNGMPTNSMNDIYESLLGTAGKQVELTVGGNVSGEGSRDVIVVPIRDEAGLYYYNWVQNNIRKVSEATNGEVGYIHIPDMGPEGLNEFVKYFYPQLDKKGLIIDDRGNGGGNVSPMIIERLSRGMTRSNMARNVLVPSQTPRQMMRGPMVMLINEYSASDGDLFPYAFKKHQLGKVVGKTTWGGVVGIRGSLPFIDGGDLRKPEFASYSAEESKWIIEGIGVEPDIYIDNDPAREYDGIDDQLDKAIEVIKEELKNYREIPDIPAPPDKSR
ncbi:MAG: PDZ domain-containing protein [Bacteroidales bacterium]|nr:PD40 domain-containing protein [Lentimicrobiaceae bacterium]MDD5693945.1 PDZ domain-containing protein [Bacteroidales bacterium]